MQGTKSSIASLFLLLLVIAPSLFGTYSYISANIRLLWGFTRGGSVPYKHFWTKIDQKHNVPLNALYVTIFVNFLMSFIYLGSETGFEIIIDSANFFYSLGFLPLLGISILTRRKYLEMQQQQQQPPKKTYFRLPHAIGTACEIFSFLFNLACCVVECFPSTYPITPANMNYTVVFGGAGIILTTVGWQFHGKKHYLVVVEEEFDAIAEEESDTYPVDISTTMDQKAS